MRLSIITINLNDKEGLQKTIESVVSQTFQDYEYIVIDGASTDGSVDVIRQYGGKISYWVSEPDTGIYNAMNKGIHQAKGEYCLFLNSGDFLYDSAVLETLFKNSFDEDIVSCGVETFSECKKFMKLPPLYVSLYTFSPGSLSHPSTLIKRSLFERVGLYIESYQIMSDWCFFVDALIINKCSYKAYDMTLSAFNLYGISTTSSYIEDQDACSFLEKRFPRIYSDYQAFEEPVFNTLYWLHSKPTVVKDVFIFPFRVVNSLLRLRSRLRIKQSIQVMKL